MDDRTIKELLCSRTEKGLEELEKAYGKLCRRIALNVLGDPQDAEECVNDAFLEVWNRVPSVNPVSVCAYLCQTVRNIAVSRLRKKNAKKRASAYSMAMEELAEDIPAFTDVEKEILQRELIEEIAAFVRTLPEESRILFMQRYWYAEPVPAIAEAVGRSSHYVSVKLSRIRNRLKRYLTERGICIQ
ncbi:MAG: sigma-70 family RNA polymerase sigma factor [Lachnospiraceae bacterium]|nr:sigma-70 family RNA polymerase sigma factor [Lachnospiraceae bacterium]